MPRHVTRRLALPLQLIEVPNFFVTGTDTGCGKTLVTTALLRRARQSEIPATGMKPVASEAKYTKAGWRNDDALAIQAESPGSVDYADINPYCFEPAIAPHIAAQQAGTRIDLAVIQGAYERLSANHKLTIVEGVGGWRVPLGSQWDVAELCQALALPALLVVGMRLGCLNHALLTVESMQASGVELIGWVANRVDPDMDCFEANLATLRQRIPAPCWGILPWLPEMPLEQASRVLKFPHEQGPRGKI